MKTLVWSLPIRIFHWFLAIGIIMAFILGEKDDFLKFHVSFGYFVGMLLFFRITFGIIGPKYSHFKDFPLSITAIKSFLSPMRNANNVYPGHNPLASPIMLGIIMMGILSVLFGIYVLEAKGLGFFNFSNFSPRVGTFKELHEIFVNTLVLLIIIHLSGVVIDKVFRGKAGTLMSIFTGYKNLDFEGTKLNTFQIVFSAFWIGLSLLVFFIVLNTLNIPKL